MSIYLAYRAAAALSRALPLKLAYWIGLRVADIFYLKKAHDRAAVMANLQTIYDYRHVRLADDALFGLTRKCFQYFGKYLVDFFRYRRLTETDLKRRISIENLQYLDEAAALKRGAILVTAHFGNWEMGGGVVASLGHRVHAMVLPQRLERVNRLFQDQRTDRGLHVMPVGTRTIRESISLLKKGEWVAVMGDRDFVGRGCPTPFFGRTAYMPRGPAWLAKNTGAVVLVGFLIRQVDDTFLLRVFPPLLPENEPSEEALRIRIANLLEKEIGERPYQWFMFIDFWNRLNGSKNGGPRL